MALHHKTANVALALKAATRLRSSLQHARSIVANMSLGKEVGIPIAFSGVSSSHGVITFTIAPEALFR
jgi:hypothetical protein